MEHARTREVGLCLHRPPKQCTPRPERLQHRQEPGWPASATWVATATSRSIHITLSYPQISDRLPTPAPHEPSWASDRSCPPESNVAPDRWGTGRAIHGAVDSTARRSGVLRRRGSPRRSGSTWRGDTAFCGGTAWWRTAACSTGAASRSSPAPPDGTASRSTAGRIPNGNRFGWWTRLGSAGRSNTAPRSGTAPRSHTASRPGAGSGRHTADAHAAAGAGAQIRLALIA